MLKIQNEATHSHISESVKAVVWLMKLEGWVYSDHPSDHGLLTKFGVASRYFPEVTRRDFSFEDACAIYEEHFLKPLNVLPYLKSNAGVEALALMIFQIGVHVGVSSAKSIVQSTAHGLFVKRFLKSPSSLIKYEDALELLVDLARGDSANSTSLLALQIAMGGYYSQRRSNPSIKPIFHAFLNRTYANAEFVTLDDATATSYASKALGGDLLWAEKQT